MMVKRNIKRAVLMFVALLMFLGKIPGMDFGVKKVYAESVAPTILIDDPTVTEGDSGGKNITYTVTLSSVSGKTITVDYATTDGTATSGSDYVSASGKLYFAPGETNKSITVTVNGDTLLESNETIILSLLNGTNATISDTQGVGTINDDDDVITTNPATLITSTGATLNGTVNAKNLSTTVTFEYGTSISYGSSVTATQSPVTGTNDTSVSAVLSGLTPNTTYHYRVNSTNSAVTTNGSDITFTTASLAAVMDVSSTSVNGTYKAGDTIPITVNFSSPVTVTGTLNLQLETGTTDRIINYTSGSGGRILTLNYTVQKEDTSEDLDYISSNALTGTVKDSLTGEDAILTLPSPGSAGSLGSNKNLVIDAKAPQVTSVTVPASATYGTGQNLDFTANFSEVVYVVTTGGTPYITATLNTGGTVNASYQSGSGTAALLFRYTIASGNIDNDGIALGASITSNGGTIKDAAENNAALTLNSLGSTTGVLVDAVAPTLISSSISADRTRITLTFSKNILDATGGSLKNSVTFSSNAGAAYNPLGGSDSVLINGDKLEITFASPLTGSQNRIKVNANSIKDSSGNLKSDVTETTNLGNSIIVSTDPVTQVAATSATAGGNVTSDGNGTILEIGVVYSAGSNPTISDSKVAASGTSTGSFTVSLTGLTATTTYYVRAFVTNDEGTSYGNEVTFTTTDHTYTAVLSKTGTYTFAAQTAGYAPMSQQSVTVSKTGTGNITNLQVALSGTNQGSFTLGALGRTSLDSSTTSTTFTVKPKDGLAAGSYIATVTVTADNGISESFNVSFKVNVAPSGGGGGGYSEQPQTPPLTQTTVTGSVIDEKTGETVKGIKAQVTTAVDGTKTVAVKSKEAILFKQPDGTNSTLTDRSKLSFSTPATTVTGTAATKAAVTLKEDGTIQVSGLPNGSETKFEVKIDLGNGQKIVIGTMDVKVSTSGDVNLTSTLIDPYGTITDAATGKIIDGADVTLYYANTDRNKANGKEPGTEVSLPLINGFKPNNNANPQVSDLLGAYGFMVYPTSDYYIVATKAGYNKYTSPTISVEQEIVKFDFSMNKTNLTKPTITLVGQADVSLKQKEAYKELGARAVDSNGVDLTEQIMISGTVDATKPGEYTIVYSVKDGTGNEASATRLVHVINTVNPAPKYQTAVIGGQTDIITGSVLVAKTKGVVVTPKAYETIKANKTITTVYILGGYAVFDKNAEKQLRSYGIKNIVRLGGVNAYETSALINKNLKISKGTPVILISNKTPQSLVKAVIANNSKNYPIVYTTASSLNQYAKKSLVSIKPEKVYIIGDVKAVSMKEEKEVLAQTSKTIRVKTVESINLIK